jgi:predicted phage baseplate assembly protein
MPIPAPLIDNRKFQDIVDEAKRLIPHFCKEWTDHNVSDPGIMLVELFAWMTESLLYRSNLVPERNYVKFLEMLGVRLAPPKAATADVTFYLAGAATDVFPIAPGVQVATLQTETSPAIVFETDAELLIRPPVVRGVFSHNAQLGDNGYVRRELNRLPVSGQSVVMFPKPVKPDDSFVIALEDDHSDHVLALSMGCERAGGAGINPDNPPIVWETWQGDLLRWVPCALERDGTGGFSRDGDVELRVPRMLVGRFSGIDAYWLRCRLVDRPGAFYRESPEIQRFFRVEARGGTVPVRHAVTVKGEIVGVSDGTPGQVFKLANTPVLERRPETDHLMVVPRDGEPEVWKEVDDFAESGPKDRYYTLDSDGTLTFGPALLQPDGAMHHFGSTPPKGSRLVFNGYRYGGGVVGNVPKGAISVTKASVPGIARVENHDRSQGGQAPESVEIAKMRAAHLLRSHQQAVTAEDFKFHTERVRGIDRARCLAPGEQPGDARAIRPGQVFMIVLPKVQNKERPTREDLTLSPDLRQNVLDDLGSRCLLGSAIEVRLPELLWVSVKADLRVGRYSRPGLLKEVEARAIDALYKFLNPFVGGVDGEGWPFGRDLYLSEV